MFVKPFCVACLGWGLIHNAFACTLFGAIGTDIVDDGGVLVAKTRDEKPGLQRFKIRKHTDGYAYLGLFTGKKERFNMGINEKGLVIARSTSGSIPKAKRLCYPRFEKEGLQAPDYIAKHFSSVDEVLAHPEVFSEPINYLLADRSKIAIVEVLPEGKRTVHTTSLGTIAHTNHFIEPQSIPLNETIGKSSATRLARIQTLLTETPKPFSLDQFIAMTQDRHDGPIRSIWRVGVRKDGLQTLAAMVIHLSSDTTTLYLTWRTQPLDPISMQTIKVDITPEVFRQTTTSFLATTLKSRN